MEFDAVSEALPKNSLNAFPAQEPFVVRSDGDRTDDAVLSVNGTLTYIQLKSLLYSGLRRDDPRVVSLLNTIKTNFTFDTNPIYGTAHGQYYFFYVASKSLRAFGDPTIVDGHGQTHDWRRELTSHLISTQGQDGSWINRQSDYWLEDNPILATTYSVLALQEARRQ